jgi:hypothetical protein
LLISALRIGYTIVVYVSEKTRESEWVDWEVRESIAQGKGVICVHKGDQPPARMPACVKELSLKVVKWNHKVLADAIEEAAQKRN